MSEASSPDLNRPIRSEDQALSDIARQKAFNLAPMTSDELARLTVAELAHLHERAERSLEIWEADNRAYTNGSLPRIRSLRDLIHAVSGELGRRADMSAPVNADLEPVE